MKLRPDDLLEIWWTDAAGTGGWRSLEDLDSLIARVRTVGWFIKLTKEGYFLAEGRNCTEGFPDFVGVSFIPRGFIKRVKILRRAPRRRTQVGAR